MRKEELGVKPVIPLLIYKALVMRERICKYLARNVHQSISGGDGNNKPSLIGGTVYQKLMIALVFIFYASPSTGILFFHIVFAMFV